GDELSARTTEQLVADVPWSGVELDGAHEQLNWLLGGMDARLLALLVDIPDGPLAGGRLQLRRSSFDPAVERRLVAPHVVAAGQDPAGLGPHDGLVDQEPALLPGLLHQCLVAGRVPLVDGALFARCFKPSCKKRAKNSTDASGSLCSSRFLFLFALPLLARVGGWSPPV